MNKVSSFFHQRSNIKQDINCHLRICFLEMYHLMKKTNVKTPEMLKDIRFEA